MTNALYTRLQATAERLIGKYGMEGTITRVVSSGPAYDPVQTPESHPCQLVFMDLDFTKIDGTLIEAGDKKGYISTKGLTIGLTTADKLVADGQEHAFKDVKPLSPAGRIVVYEFLIAS